MKHLTQTLTAHPVGQGLFYSGKVKIAEDQLPDSSFRFVFDCGSLNTQNANEEVILYRQRNFDNNPDVRLDLLVISHFDADHVSHIEKLLAGGRKVDKLILPFTTLEERLFLVLKNYASMGRRTLTGDDFPIRFMLDPIGSLRDNLDGDSTIYMVNSDQKPFDGPNDGINDRLNSAQESAGFSFEINTVELEPDIGIQFYIGNLSTVPMKMFNDSEKGMLTFGYSQTAFMEFLFYRKNVGAKDREFFKAVFKAFCKKYGLCYSDKSKVSVDQLIEKIKKIGSARPIIKIFQEVKTRFPDLRPGRNLANLNTTALCMLHYNLPGIYALRHPERGWITEHISFIKKFDGTNNTRIEDSENAISMLRHGWQHEYSQVHFPNCLLTSDTYIKSQDEVNQFYQKFQYYWNSFWLFQIPHHGASSSSDLELLNRLPYRLVKFINHGARKIRNWQHPSPVVIDNLVASGQSSDVVPVNEFTGLEFGISYPY